MRPTMATKVMAGIVAAILGFVLVSQLRGERRFTRKLQAESETDLARILSSLNAGNTYNARIIVRVTSGSGRVTAYGSVVDNLTSDPTYVPAQK